MVALIALIILDYISGVIAAAVEKRLSSEVGAKGIAKKIFMLLIVALANIVDINVIGDGHVLKTVTVVFRHAKSWLLHLPLKTLLSKTN